MNFLQSLFLESPVRLGVFSFVIFAAALIVRKRSAEGVGRRALPAVAAVILSLYLVQWLVQTQREQILERFDAFVGAIEAGEARRAGTIVARGFDCDDMDRDGFVRFLDSALSRVSIYDSRFLRKSVEVHGASAAMLVTARATVSIEGGIGDMHWGTWELEWTREADDWGISAVRPRRVDGVEFQSLRQLRMHMP